MFIFKMVWFILRNREIYIRERERERERSACMYMVNNVIEGSWRIGFVGQTQTHHKKSVFKI